MEKLFRKKFQQEEDPLKDLIQSNDNNIYFYIDESDSEISF
jgi:hypothetical protein